MKDRLNQKPDKTAIAFASRSPIDRFAVLYIAQHELSRSCRLFKRASNGQSQYAMDRGSLRIE